MKKKLTAVEYIEENFSSSKTLGELKQIIKDAKVLEKEQLEFAQSKMYSEEDMKNAFDSGREFNSLDGVVDIHIVLPMGGDMTDLQPLYPTFEEWFETVKKNNERPLENI